MCSNLIGYQNWWSHGHPKTLGQMNRGILVSCGNQYCTGILSARQIDNTSNSASSICELTTCVHQSLKQIFGKPVPMMVVSSDAAASGEVAARKKEKKTIKKKENGRKSRAIDPEEVLLQRDKVGDDKSPRTKKKHTKKQKKSKKKKNEEEEEPVDQAASEAAVSIVLPFAENSTTKAENRAFCEEDVAKNEEERAQKKANKKDKKKNDKKRKKDDDGGASMIGTEASGISKKSRKKKRKKDRVDDDVINCGGRDKKDDCNDETRSIAGERIVLVVPSATNYSPNGESKESEISDVNLGADRQPDNDSVDVGGVTLLLFYQYVEPPWDNHTFGAALEYVQKNGEKYGLGGRMRVSAEGLNCTITGSYNGVRSWCRDLRSWGTRSEFKDTEFKLTDRLPTGQMFPKLHAFKVAELVNYGLVGKNAPSISKAGVHLEPDDYHRKIAEPGTVIIDVRNHYEANIGKFVPPPSGAEYIDPNMRKSTEFPVWLDRPETKEKLRGKQVLMYCTGGVRCERASALLRHKMEMEDDTKDLGIKGVYQLQGGVDKYFKKFPEGGWWEGKNYTFDKRFAHAPPAVEEKERAAKVAEISDGAEAKTDTDATDRLKGNDKWSGDGEEKQAGAPMGKCEACSKPWDMYRGKRRCPTCGVPSLICRQCMEADRDGNRKLGKEVRCDLCVSENVTSKGEVLEKMRREMEHYERKLREKQEGNEEGDNNIKQWCAIDSDLKLSPNPDSITRLFLSNMCTKQMDESILVKFLSGISHIQWLTDYKTKAFHGKAFVEMSTPDDAARAISKGGQKVLERPIVVRYAPPDPKHSWPPRRCAVGEETGW